MGCAWCRDDKLDAFASIEDVKKGDVVVIDCSQNKDAEKSYKLQRVKDAHWLGADELALAAVAPSFSSQFS